MAEEVKALEALMKKQQQRVAELEKDYGNMVKSVGILVNEVEMIQRYLEKKDPKYRRQRTRVPTVDETLQDKEFMAEVIKEIWKEKLGDD